MKKIIFLLVSGLITTVVTSYTQVVNATNEEVLPTVPCQNYGIQETQYTQCFNGGRLYLSQQKGRLLQDNIINRSQTPMFLYEKDRFGVSGFELHKLEMQ